MKLLTLFICKLGRVIGVFLFLLILTSANWPWKTVTPIIIDKKSITVFHELNEIPLNKLNPNVNLFIDYSTCVVEAVKSSAFFRQIRPKITGINPTLYGLKGNTIEKISSNQDLVNQELNNIRDIPYADILGASQKICNGTDQAILITDGEYWTIGGGERTDLAYLKDSFVKWLSRGFEIYIYIEPYIEKYKGNNYDKKRFYFIFTDDNLPNNIYKELNRAFTVSPTSANLKLIKLSNSETHIKERSKINDQLSSTIIVEDKFSAYEIDDEWKDLDKYILNGVNPVDGTLIPGGNYLLSGLKMALDPISPYIYTQLELKVYQVSDNYINSQKVDYKINEVKDIFILDNNLYKKTGEIGIKLSNNYPNSLSTTTENLLRIDIVVKTSDKKINKTDFEWKSMSKSEINISVFESILQTIDNQDINPERINKVLHTIYLKTKSL